MTDAEIKNNYNRLLLLQIEEQEIKNDILRRLYLNGVIINHHIVKYNELQYNYNKLINPIVPKSPPLGMYN